MHRLNERLTLERTWSKPSEIKTKRQKRTYNYHEIAGEYFALFTFDYLRKSIESVTTNPLLDKVRELYFQTNVNQRKDFCGWLLKNSYDEVKKKLRDEEMKEHLRKIIIE